MKEKLIASYVRLMVEQIRQAQLSGDRVSEWGSDDHIMDLENRIADVAYWRDKCKNGSEKRGHYRNVYNQLKRELRSARRRKQLNEKEQ